MLKILVSEYREQQNRLRVIPDSLWQHPDCTLSIIRTWCLLDSLISDGKPHPWPSYASVAKRCFMDRRSAIRAVAWLREHGYLEIQTVNGHSNHYAMLCPQLVTSETPTSDIKDTTANDIDDTHSISTVEHNLDISKDISRVEVASAPTLVASKDNGEDKELTDKQKEAADHKRFCSQIGELLAYINHRMSVEFEVGLTTAERGPAARMLKTWLKDFTPREVALAIEYAYNDTEDRNLKRAREKATNLLSVYVFKPLLVDAYNDESPTLQRELKWMTWSE